MSKLFQAILTGVFFAFILDFTLFLGIFLNYIKALNIELFYNILFADNQNIYIFLAFSGLIGYLIIYVKNIKIVLTSMGVLFSFALFSLIPTIGYNIGELFFMKKNVTFKDKKYRFIGDIYYDGRAKITFYDYELKKTILLDKKDLIR
ncbi:MAG: hypothetical protein JXQ66_01515 [Campylobacterales bacterium]|nr:hypothetical protein [Campylobacterales bacterium]